MITNAPAFRLWFNTGKKLLECGAAWPNRAGTGFNVQMDSLAGQRQMFLVPNLDKDGKPQGTAPFKILYNTGRVRSDGGQHTRYCGVAHVTSDRLGYDLYVADPFGNLRLVLRPLIEPTSAANDSTRTNPEGWPIPDPDPIPDAVGDCDAGTAVSARGTRYDAETGEVIEGEILPPAASSPRTKRSLADTLRARR